MSHSYKHVPNYHAVRIFHTPVDGYKYLITTNATFLFSGQI